MPYCPKCDMEFVEGITVCTDCGGPLVESEEVAKAMKAQEQAEAMAREKAMYQEYLKSFQTSGDELPDNQDSEAESSGEEDDKDASSGGSPSILPPEPARVYVDKSQKYDDLKSSASAFLIVGGILLVVSALLWSGIVAVPMARVSRLIFQTVLTVMGLFSLLVWFNTSRSARKLAPEIAQEKARTAELIEWFVSHYTADAIDSAIPGCDSLTEEELSLKRFQLIQDYLITNHDLPDPAYVDALCEDIYARLFDQK